MANLYAIRSRAVKDLRKLHDDWYGVMSARLDRLLSEFIDAWNAGRAPARRRLPRARVARRSATSSPSAWTTGCSLAPTPDYGADALAAIRAEPAFAGAIGGDRGPARARGPSCFRGCASARACASPRPRRAA